MTVNNTSPLSDLLLELPEKPAPVQPKPRPKISIDSLLIATGAQPKPDGISWSEVISQP